MGKIVDGQIKLIHINKKQKSWKVRDVGRLIVRLLNETNYRFNQAPSYMCGITNIIFCDESSSISLCEGALLVLQYSLGTTDYS